MDVYRLSDLERDEAISALSDAYADGRLDIEEFDRRMEAASRAVYATDLDPLFADLPRRARRNQTLVVPGRRAVRVRPRVPWLLVPVALFFVLAVVTHVWLLIPLLIVTAKLNAHRHWNAGR